MEAQWSSQWSLNGRYWSAKGGAMVVHVQGRQKRSSNWYIMFTTVRIYLRCDQWPTTVRPFCDHGDACAFLLSFLSDLPPRRPLCDCFEHAQNFTATVASMVMSERPVYHPWTNKTTVLPPFCVQRRPGQLSGYVVVQGRHNGRSPCVKGVLMVVMHSSFKWYNILVR